MRVFPLMAGVLLATAAARAQSVTPGASRIDAPQGPAEKGTAPGDATLGPLDRQFLENAAQGAAFEMKIAQLAGQYAHSKKVVGYSRMVQQDHGAYNQALSAVAQRYGVTLPTEPAPQDQARAARLEKLRGAAFDRAYVAEIRRINEADQRDLRQEADHTHRPEIKDFATRFAAIDEKHAAQAKALP